MRAYSIFICTNDLRAMKGVYLPPGAYRPTGANEADDINRKLPPGRGFICLDTSTLASTMQNIFRGTVMLNN